MEKWLRAFRIHSYKIKNDKSVDVYGNVSLGNNNLYKIKVKFNEIHGVFNIAGNLLETLYGCPEIVHSGFNCSSNLLTTLKYAPKKVKGLFSCHSNKLKNYDYLPLDLKIDSEKDLAQINGYASQKYDMFLRYIEKRILLDPESIPVNVIDKFDAYGKLRKKYKMFFILKDFELLD